MISPQEKIPTPPIETDSLEAELKVEEGGASEKVHKEPQPENTRSGLENIRNQVELQNRIDGYSPEELAELVSRYPFLKTLLEVYGGNVEKYVAESPGTNLYKGDYQKNTSHVGRLIRQALAHIPPKGSETPPRAAPPPTAEKPAPPKWELEGKNTLIEIQPGGFGKGYKRPGLFDRLKKVFGRKPSGPVLHVETTGAPEKEVAPDTVAEEESGEPAEVVHAEPEVAQPETEEPVIEESAHPEEVSASTAEAEPEQPVAKHEDIFYRMADSITETLEAWQNIPEDSPDDKKQKDGFGKHIFGAWARWTKKNMGTADKVMAPLQNMFGRLNAKVQEKRIDRKFLPLITEKEKQVKDIYDNWMMKNVEEYRIAQMQLFHANKNKRLDLVGSINQRGTALYRVKEIHEKYRGEMAKVEQAALAERSELIKRYQEALAEAAFRKKEVGQHKEAA